MKAMKGRNIPKCIYYVVLMGILSNNSFGQEMRIYEFPLSDNTLNELSKSVDVRNLSDIHDPVPSRLLACALSDEGKSSLKWLLENLDGTTKVQGILRTQQAGFFWVLAGNQGSHRLCFPISKPFTNNSKTQINSLLFLFQGAFEFDDPEYRPFAFSGSLASEVVDFTHPATEGSKKEWATSRVFCTSREGDALFIRDDGTAAWHQIETNRVIPIGTTRNAVVGFLDSAFRGTRFSSWTFPKRR